MAVKIINFKVNDNNPDDVELLAFFEITKTFDVTKSGLCKLALKRLLNDILANNLQDGSFSQRLIDELSKSEKIQGSAQALTAPTANPNLEITDSESDVLPEKMAGKMKDMLKGI